MDGMVVDIRIGEQDLTCVVASTHASRISGLSEYQELPKDGMIFIYDQDHTAKFQRRTMSGLDISIGFFDAEGNLVGSGWTGEEAIAEAPYRYVVESFVGMSFEGKLSIKGPEPTA